MSVKKIYFQQNVRYAPFDFKIKKIFWVRLSPEFMVLNVSVQRFFSQLKLWLKNSENPELQYALGRHGAWMQPWWVMVHSPGLHSCIMPTLRGFINTIGTSLSNRVTQKCSVKCCLLVRFYTIFKYTNTYLRHLLFYISEAQIYFTFHL